MHGIYLEDLFVRPNAPGSGLGKALLTALAEECMRRGYSRLRWWVLDWNEPAISFYTSLGAVPMDEWDGLPGQWRHSDLWGSRSRSVLLTGRLACLAGRQ